VERRRAGKQQAGQGLLHHKRAAACTRADKKGSGRGACVFMQGAQLQQPKGQRGKQGKALKLGVSL